MHFDESDQLFVTYAGNARKCIQSRKLNQAGSCEQMNESDQKQIEEEAEESTFKEATQQPNPFNIE